MGSILGIGLGTGLRFTGGALFATLLSAFLSLLKAIGLALDGDDLGVMDEAIDQGDDTGGAGEDLVPFGERFIGRDQCGFFFVSTHLR